MADSELRVFVTGGAGYIGSHMVKALVRAGASVTVFDNLSSGHRDAVRDAEFIEGDLREISNIRGALKRHRFDAVMHFAACYDVAESVRDPQKYYANNITGSQYLVGAMVDADVKSLVFSSTCAVYGDPVRLPLTEDHPKNPVNPYGESKLEAERIMANFGEAQGLRTISLRYFNAAGSDPDGELGERHEPETHLIPLVLREAYRTYSGGAPEDTTLQLFGEDFETPDGTCVRDYVHVSDLCTAHLLALRRLLSSADRDAFEAFNLGIGRGYSVKEVIATCQEATGVHIRYEVAPRRPGDPAILVANAANARRTLRWEPQFTELSSMVTTAWKRMIRSPQ